MKMARKATVQTKTFESSKYLPWNTGELIT